jgi:hypothetical protein
MIFFVRSVEKEGCFRKWLQKEHCRWTTKSEQQRNKGTLCSSARSWAANFGRAVTLSSLVFKFQQVSRVVLDLSLLAWF